LARRSPAHLLLAVSFLLLVFPLAERASKASAASAPRQQPAAAIEIDATAAAKPFPHFWEQMFGSGRAILSLRESYRQDLRSVKQITGFQYVRFHAILHDEVGLYQEDSAGNPGYNFSYIDQIYDGLLASGIRPCVELSFMPARLAANPALTQSFWYHPIVSPPKNYTLWGELVSHFARHLVERYGIDEVAQWYFEVWNEPNLDFWAGDPREATYYNLYDHAARALKGVSPRLRVGGPATAQAAWVDRFLRHCLENRVPVDFVSTHVYGNDPAQDVFGTPEQIPRTEFVCRAVRKVHDQIAASSAPNTPLLWTEYNASYKNEPEVTDAPFMGPWLADTIRQCDGLTEMMSYWTFSDVFEEQGVVKKPFYGGFGLIAVGHIPKAAFNAFALLHQLGDQRLPIHSDSALATIHGSALDIALWNLYLPEQQGQPRSFTLHFAHLRGTSDARIWIVDADHGSPLHAYDAMGRPPFPSRQQQAALRKAAQMPDPQSQHLSNDSLTLTLRPHSLALIEIR
jgi:xylan 1,4-beta-xylosidase